MRAKSGDAVVTFIASSLRQKMLDKQSSAAALFEARFTLNALLRVDPVLRERLETQRGLFHESLVTGEDDEIIEQGEAMCRGWHAAITAMEKSGIADDACHIGVFGELIVAIGRQQHAPEWLRDRYGGELIWLTPRECAAMFFQIREVRAAKEEWPDAEIIDVLAKCEGGKK